MNTETEARDVIQVLRSYCDRCDELMDAIGEKRSLTRDETNRIRELYAALKSDLNAVAKRGATISGMKSLNKFESGYLIPAVTEAACELRAPTNTNPITSNWHSQLYAAQIDLKFMLHQLEDQFPEFR